MTAPIPPSVDCDRQHTTFAVRDIRAAFAYYTTKLGFTPGFLWGEPEPTFAGVNLDRTQLFLARGEPNPAGVGAVFMIGNADELFEFQKANGVSVVEPPGDRDYGIRDYSVRDLDGYHLTFGHPLYNLGPAVDIERVDVPLRLEKRLAAVLRDLAEFKRMSLSSCLEETLLHTFEPLGDGVASPHTARDLRHIQELKRKHGIDYDCHASYRFREASSGF